MEINKQKRSALSTVCQRPVSTLPKLNQHPLPTRTHSLKLKEFRRVHGSTCTANGALAARTAPRAERVVDDGDWVWLGDDSVPLPPAKADFRCIKDPRSRIA
jgi:hypothetical protein